MKAMKYFFSICALLLIFLNVAKASEHTVFQREASLGSLPTVFSSDLFLSKKSDSLLNKVISTNDRESTKHWDNYWENREGFLPRIYRLYSDFWKSLFGSLLSVFVW
ncbi:hypothetical protein [Bartonella tribocorum]|uniref:Uncharacterized protein n=1 Tax=Bartonella tribocorum TaxID=85701 RepID=A0A2M6URH0_9HYPH|nr:hypothetical protein [Bartonella tribocorum]PIT68763.1 hypothetical protein CEV08_07450 [Bartonella tribocorum]